MEIMNLLLPASEMADLRSIQRQFRVDPGSIWRRSMVDLASIQSRSRLDLGSIQGRFGNDQEWFAKSRMSRWQRSCSQRSLGGALARPSTFAGVSLPHRGCQCGTTKTRQSRPTRWQAWPTVCDPVPLMPTACEAW